MTSPTEVLGHKKAGSGHNFGSSVFTFVSVSPCLFFDLHLYQFQICLKKEIYKFDIQIYHHSGVET